MSLLPRCQVEALPHDQYQFSIDGRVVTRWHYGSHAPRPYFYPMVAGCGKSVTRLGHPGAPNHDHHRSFWFAHHDLLGIDFWSENTESRIRQTGWKVIDESDDAATLVVDLVWTDGHDPQPLIQQTLFATVRPENSGTNDWSLELQSDLVANAEGIEFRQSNFGILGLRVAKSLSVVFGEGQILGADGRQGEKELFGQANRWIDYSGPIDRSTDSNPTDQDEFVRAGIALVDHRDNLQQPDIEQGRQSVSWHVRDDGWIGPSVSRHGNVPIVQGQKLSLRYLAYIHDGEVHADYLDRLADSFDQRPALDVVKGTRPHHQWELAKTE